MSAHFEKGRELAETAAIKEGRMEDRGSSKFAGLLVTGALVASLAVSPAFSVTPPQETSHGNQWEMVYEAGVAPLKGQSPVKVTISEDNVILKAKKGSLFSICAANITAVSSNLVSRRTASRNQAAAWVAAVQFSPYMLMALPFGLVGMAATYPIKSHYAYVSILWTEKGTEQEVLLKLSRRDYAPFLAELQKATGKDWKNLDTEWERVQQELKSAGANKISVQLAQKVRIVKSDLKPGAYQLVLLEREANRGELYFFPGNQIDIEHLAAVAVVEIEPLASGIETEQVNFKQDKNGITRISDIRTASRTLRFP
jgi:hypothetical protein